eukprot:403582_1
MNNTFDSESDEEIALKRLIPSTTLTSSSDIAHGYCLPIYYKSPTDNKEYILISARFDDSYVYLYDIKCDCWIKKWKYPNQFKPKFHAAVLNEQTNTLYIFGGHFNVFGTLNLTTGIWNIKCYGTEQDDEKEIAKQHNIQYYLSFNSTFINNTIHVYHKGEYLTYNHDTQQFISTCVIAKTAHEKKWEENKIVHITAPYSKLLLIGGEYYNIGDGDNTSKNIWCLDMETVNMRPKLLDVKLVEGMKYYRYIPIIGFGSILFIFRVGYDQDIMCLDTMISHKWYKSNVKMIKFSSFSFAVKTANNNVHFLKCDDILHDAYHFKISLYDVVPCELRKLYEIHYEQLVSGYIRLNIEELCAMLIPNSLKDLVAQYYSCFQ